MSTDTFVPTIGATAADNLAAAKTHLDKVAQAALWPIAVAKKLLNAMIGGWKAAYGYLTEGTSFVSSALKTIPSSVKGALIAAPFATEAGYEKARGAAYWLAKAAGKIAGFATRTAGKAVLWGAGMLARGVTAINENAGNKVSSVLFNIQMRVEIAAQKVSKTYSSILNYVFAALGHRIAVTTVTTGATGIAALVAAEALSIGAVKFSLLPMTLSGFVTGSAVLSSVPLIPAMLTSAGVVAIGIGGLVLAGGLAAAIFRRSEVRDIFEADQAEAATVVIPGEVVKAEYEHTQAQIDATLKAKAEAEALVSDVRGGKNHGGKRHK